MNFTNTEVLSIQNLLVSEDQSEMIAGIYKGLIKPQKQISSRFFYDDQGSSFFEDITRLPEYYPTRTEKSIIKSIAPQIMAETESIDLIELGSGDSSKISLLLNAVPKNKIENIRYIPVDVSEAAIIKSSEILVQKYPGLRIHGLLADFMKHLTMLPGKNNRLICFFGSTLGNLTRKQANQFLVDIGNLMLQGDRFLLGLDLVKNSEIIEKAYNDAQGVTAAFNVNILRVINQYADTNFNTDLFEHIAFYNTEKSRIEMHLRALKNMSISSPNFPQKINVIRGETIHTENSHKFTMNDIYEFSKLSNLKTDNIFTDHNQWFSVVSFKK